MQPMWVQSLGQEYPLEKEMATHSRILAWKIPWKRSLAGYSPWGHKRVEHDLATKQQQQQKSTDLVYFVNESCSSIVYATYVEEMNEWLTECTHNMTATRHTFCLTGCLLLFKFWLCYYWTKRPQKSHLIFLNLREYGPHFQIFLLSWGTLL